LLHGMKGTNTPYLDGISFMGKNKLSSVNFVPRQFLVGLTL